MFGADDADWAIYRKIVSTNARAANNEVLKSTQSMAAGSSDEEEDLVSLQTVEQKLLAYDPTFTLEHTHASLTSQRSALMQAFRPQYGEGDVEGE